jgi:crotonobetainyl-CoA:carnitine CoA-transferase CaiB-like acyl-CoA transferase
LTVELEAALRAKAAADWEPLLNSLGIPAGRVLTVPEALELPQIKDRPVLQRFDRIPGLDRAIAVTRAGFDLSDGNPAASSPPPRLGQHTTEILQRIGYSTAEIEGFRQSGAI